MSKLNIKLDINDELGKKVSDRLNRRNINLDSYLLELIQKDIDSKKTSLKISILITRD